MEKKFLKSCTIYSIFKILSLTSCYEKLSMLILLDFLILTVEYFVSLTHTH